MCEDCFVLSIHQLDQQVDVGFMQKCNIWCLSKSPQSNCQIEAPLKSGLLQRLQHFHKVCCRGDREVEAETSCSYGCAAAA